MYKGIANGEMYLDLEALSPSSSEENKFNLLNE
jgi:hypothetical protein